jgi:hypothetical protein
MGMLPTPAGGDRYRTTVMGSTVVATPDAIMRA